MRCPKSPWVERPCCVVQPGYQDAYRAIPPRSYFAESFRGPFLIFTDGAWESGSATGGAATYDPLTDASTVLQ